MPREDDTLVKEDAAAQVRLQYPPLLPVHMQDLENAIAYSLRHEVILKRDITGDVRNALFNWVTVLVNYFPGERRVMDSLLAVREYLEQRQTLTGEVFENKIKEMDAQAGSKPTLPKVGPYVTCLGSKKRFVIFRYPTQ
jgi:hypothetical protein